MNASDILKNGHATVMTAIEGLPETTWTMPGACGIWSVKDIMAHFASFERVLVDTLNSLLNQEPTPHLDKFIGDHEQFNDAEVEARRDRTVAEVLAEYEQAYHQALELLNQIPVERRRQNGILPWYGDIYDLEDFIVYTFYAHKREHCGQIGIFRDR